MLQRPYDSHPAVGVYTSLRHLDGATRLRHFHRQRVHDLAPLVAMRRIAHSGSSALFLFSVSSKVSVRSTRFRLAPWYGRSIESRLVGHTICRSVVAAHPTYALRMWLMSNAWHGEGDEARLLRAHRRGRTRTESSFAHRAHHLRASMSCLILRTASAGPRPTQRVQCQYTAALTACGTACDHVLVFGTVHMGWTTSRQRTDNLGALLLRRCAAHNPARPSDRSCGLRCAAQRQRWTSARLLPLRAAAICLSRYAATKVTTALFAHVKLLSTHSTQSQNQAVPVPGL